MFSFQKELSNVMKKSAELLRIYYENCLANTVALSEALAQE